ncbi:hypothetical protein GPJ56_007867 [Histomonas meleagridis]|uniref:uncharacterized protein n=1 Tax=Histomonas meleagridis TaxID=135588 RepID=UPI00355AAC0A|nr:hypothetical protein GPJ56_007867 [Histomonas meleagridis]KAH0804087.1 hypothetical protein GO595_002917 [Histomonas meleagridis]
MSFRDRRRFYQEQGRTYGGHIWNRSDRDSPPRRVPQDNYWDERSDRYRGRTPISEIQRSHSRPYDDRRFQDKRYMDNSDPIYVYNRNDSEKYQRHEHTRYQSEPQIPKEEPIFEVTRNARVEQPQQRSQLEEAKRIVEKQRELYPPIGIFTAPFPSLETAWD